MRGGNTWRKHPAARGAPQKSLLAVMASVHRCIALKARNMFQCKPDGYSHPQIGYSKTIQSLTADPAPHTSLQNIATMAMGSIEDERSSDAPSSPLLPMFADQ